MNLKRVFVFLICVFQLKWNVDVHCMDTVLNYYRKTKMGQARHLEQAWYEFLTAVELNLRHENKSSLSDLDVHVLAFLIDQVMKETHGNKAATPDFWYSRQGR